MPEGPEVTIIRDYLRIQSQGKQLFSINIDVHSKYYHRVLKGYELLKNKFPLTIIDVTSKGKSLFFVLQYQNERYYLHSTLGLEGYWIDHRITHPRTQKSHSNLWLTLLSQGIFTDLYYDDSRHFGNISIYNQNEYEKKIQSLGPDLLNDQISYDQ